MGKRFSMDLKSGTPPVWPNNKTQSHRNVHVAVNQTVQPLDFLNVHNWYFIGGL